MYLQRTHNAGMWIINLLLALIDQIFKKLIVLSKNILQVLVFATGKKINATIIYDK